MHYIIVQRTLNKNEFRYVVDVISPIFLKMDFKTSSKENRSKYVQLQRSVIIEVIVDRRWSKENERRGRERHTHTNHA